MFIQFPTSYAKKRINSTKFTDSCFLGSTTKFPRSSKLSGSAGDWNRLFQEATKQVPGTLLSVSWQFGAKFGTGT